MIQTKNIETLEDFKRLGKGDLVAIEWRRDMYCGDKECRLGTYKIIENKERCTEIILQKKHNVYFNYNLFLNPDDGISNCKNIVLIRIIE